MIKKLKLVIMTAIATAMIATPVLAPAVAFAAPTDATDATVQSGLCQGATLQVSENAADCTVDPATTNKKVNDTISWVINIFSIVVGLAAVIMIIVGGLRYIISGGDSGNVQSAKNTILYAIIGLVVVALAQFIVRFVLTKLAA